MFPALLFCPIGIRKISLVIKFQFSHEKKKNQKNINSKKTEYLIKFVPGEGSLKVIETLLQHI